MPAARAISMSGPNTFKFLNRSSTLPAQGGWNDIALDKLWLYNLHYFDDLNAQTAHTRTDWHRALIARWVAENSTISGTGWEPYPTSLRIVNWLKWELAGNSLPDQCLQSLILQVRWLTKRMEWHILGNHLFANAKALVFAGIFFDGPEARKWLDFGLRIISQELSEQVLPDGGHFELSPMYHEIFLEDILDLINLTGTFPDVVASEHVSQWRELAIKLLTWFRAMCHPDDEISFFNDAAIGIAPAPNEIKKYASRLSVFSAEPARSTDKITVNYYAESGYIRLDAMSAVAFLDVGPIGPDYLPGHAHADSLSFELSLYGERVLVNSGTSQYGSGEVRLKERGTAAHNTVEVNGENSSEVWSGFRVAKRAYPRSLMIDEREQSVLVTCTHDGYARLPGQPEHWRTWELSRGKIIVRDRIKGKFDFATARFHFHPDVQITALGDQKWALRLLRSGKDLQAQVLRGSASLEKSFYSPEFGMRQASECLAVRFESVDDIEIVISWSDDD